MLSPLRSIFGVCFSFGISLLVFYFTSIDPKVYFFLPIFLLILYHTVMIQYAETNQCTRRPLRRIFKKSIAKYCFWLILIGALYGIYSIHPFYQRFTPHTRIMLLSYLKLYAVGALPYFLYVESTQSGPFEWQNDPYLKGLVFLRTFWRRQWRRLIALFFKSRMKSLFLSWLIRLHYLPVMVEQVYYGIRRMSEFANSTSFEYTLANTAFLFTAVLFLIDSTNASIGYFWESVLTKTRFRAIDPYPFHWIVVLICYVPFIRYMRDFVPFPSGDSRTPLLIAHPSFELIVNGLTITALLGIVLSTSCLGFSYSNLSYKKIQTRGPYAIVRHPGTVFKIAFFFLSIFRYQSSYTFPIIAAYLFWMSVYITRAVCEERFLCRFKAYSDYMEKTPYRFIPGRF